MPKGSTMLQQTKGQDLESRSHEAALYGITLSRLSTQTDSNSPRSQVRYEVKTDEKE